MGILLTVATLLPLSFFQEDAAPAERALQTGRPADATAACAQLERMIARDGGTARLRALLARLYLLAGAEPAAGEALAEARKDAPDLQIPEGDPPAWNRLESFSHAGYTVRLYRRDTDGPFSAVFFRENRYAFHYRTHGKALVLKVGGFGSSRVVAVPGAADARKFRQAVLSQESQRAQLEAADRLLEEPPDKATDRLYETARAFADAVARKPAPLGLVHTLAHLYDRLGEAVAGRERESDYRRLQLAAAKQIADAAPEAPSARASLALAYFRIGAYPLSIAEAKAASADPLARDIAAILGAWGQDRHELVERFDAGPDVQVELYRTLKEAPDTAMLFPELTYIATRKDRWAPLVYPFSSQKLKEKRHFYLYSQILASRTLLTSFADIRPDEKAVRARVVDSLRKLTEKKPDK